VPGGVDCEGIGIQEIEKASAGALGEGYFGLTPANVVVGFRRVIALEPKVLPIEPDGIAIYDAGVTVSAAHVEMPAAADG
jgi:hypothetical protein